MCNHCPCFNPVEYSVDRWHHRLRHRLWWLRFCLVSGGATWHAQAASLHQAASEQVPLRSWGTHICKYSQKNNKKEKKRKSLTLLKCGSVSHSSTSTSTTALDSCPHTTPSMSNSANCWAQRRRKLKMRRNSRVKKELKRPGDVFTWQEK